MTSKDSKTNPLADTLRTYLAQNPTDLNLRYCPITDEISQLVAASTTLVRVNFSSSTLTSAMFRTILAISRSITSYNLGSSAVKTDAFVGITSDIVEELLLGGLWSSVTDTSVQSIVIGCPRLRKLDINACNITDVGAGYMKLALSLEDLNLNSIVNFTDKTAYVLSKCPKLTKLLVAPNRFTGIGAAALADNKTITYLDISVSLLGSVGVRAFLANRTITTLFIQNFGQTTDITALSDVNAQIAMNGMTLIPLSPPLLPL